MKRIRYNGLAVATLTMLALVLGAALASADPATCPGNTPVPTAYTLGLRDFNDCPTSVLTTTNDFSTNHVNIFDDVLDCFGYANRHTWSFSTDGIADAQFENCSLYRWCADVTLHGTGGGEGGLRLSPWWSPHDDGQFMLNASSGEIACFGGRLPFFSFTSHFGLHYVKGTTVHMEAVYNPNGLTQASRAYIVYNLTMGSSSYTSGPLYFDQGNTSENPPHGLWGELWPAYAGGYVQCYVGNGTPVNFGADWSNICFDYVSATPTRSSTWGKLKTMYR